LAKRQIGILGWKREIDLSISFFWAALLVVLLFSGLFVLLKTDSERKDVEFFALAVTAAATIGSVFYLGETFRLQADSEKESEAFALVARWNSPDMFHARRSWHKVSEVFQKPEAAGGGAAGVKLLLLNPQEERANHNIRYLLNFYEEIAMAVKHSHADEQLLQSFFKSIIARAREAFAEWIPEHRRITGRPDIWDQFDWLCQRWHN